MNTEYSFLTSLYKNSNLDEFKDSLSSMIGQTIKPNQIVIVLDGIIADSLREYIDEIAVNKNLYTIVELKENVGLGNALKIGMTYCRNEFVARMDTDDICVLERIEKQMKMFNDNPELSIVGSNIAEFVDNTNNIVAYRNVPVEHKDICNYLKKRCPFNHMTVLFKKSEVEKAGGYLDWHFDEDSYLWVRMYLAGSVFANIPEILVYARVNNDTYKRRGGYSYYKSEIALFKFMYDKKVIKWYELLEAKFIRFVVQVLMPNNLRQWFFKTFARSKR